MTPREYLIQTIENLWPVDSEYPDTASDGKQLLRMAWEEYGPAQPEWRKLPYDVIREYARLCARKEFMYDEEDVDFENWYKELIALEGDDFDERPVCKIKNGLNSWELTVDNHEYYFVGGSLAEELARVYEKAGYKIIFKQK